MRARHKASEAGKKAAPDRVSKRHIRAGVFTTMLATLTKMDDEDTAASNSVFIFETWLQQTATGLIYFPRVSEVPVAISHSALHGC